ncbi:ferredoxin [Thetidibacter halocola]|uniref:Ferredoxin n=1 Tax=Thetidibacter halocola TaxID=2827239 RepID=A0A8J8B8L1_9RHOB|nr:ferredoxin [Thetidibacter halocola]MBS0125627.1 ferredoxin [Thetidibacter halocola]
MTLAPLSREAAACALSVRGAFHPTAEDGAPDGTGTLILLGPDEPDFWPVFAASPEYGDGAPDPLDRWSKRVIGILAARWGGMAVFPSDGPPWPPFIGWALRSGRAWVAPVGLLVHEAAGLFASYRGAVVLPDRLDLPAAPAMPCDTCAAKPCETACPVGAMAPGQAYDVATCKAHVTSEAGRECRQGCLVRRACPVSRAFGRLPEQSAFHMRAFLGD